MITQLREMLPVGWKASLRAVDGSMIDDLAHQLSGLPSDTSHLIVSMGGNDVLAEMDLLGARVKSIADALQKLRERVLGFERSYRRAVDSIRAPGWPTTFCTIYNGNLTQSDASAFGLGDIDVGVLRVALSAFNDVITRVAFEHKLDLIDLRLVCNEPVDYANPIEPSSLGGEKIARAIVRALGLAGQPANSSRVFS